MKLQFIPLLLQMVAVLWAIPASASEPIYEGYQTGVGYKIYIENKESLGNERFRLRTRAVFEKTDAPDYLSKWRVADCKNRTFDGKPVPKVAEFGYQRGAPEIYNAICGKKP